MGRRAIGTWLIRDHSGCPVWWVFSAVISVMFGDEFDAKRRLILCVSFLFSTIVLLLHTEPMYDLLCVMKPRKHFRLSTPVQTWFLWMSLIPLPASHRVSSWYEHVSR